MLVASQPQGNLMDIQFFGGASEGQVMTLVAGETEICTFGRARERQVYVEHLITESTTWLQPHDRRIGSDLDERAGAQRDSLDLGAARARKPMYLPAFEAAPSSLPNCTRRAPLCSSGTAESFTMSIFQRASVSQKAGRPIASAMSFGATHATLRRAMVSSKDSPACLRSHAP